MIPYSRQSVSEEDIAAVVEVLRSGYLTQGPVVHRFEGALAAYCTVREAVAACNATAALHAGCAALGVTADDLVWVPAISFVATANCARFCGASVDFVDVDPMTGLLCLGHLDQKIQEAKTKNRLPKLLITVHLAGQSCLMEAIYTRCAAEGIAVMEDASHALGSWYQGQPVGACPFSDCAVFSFHPVKPITSGEGGVLVTNSEALARRARLFISHGIQRDPEQFNTPSCADGWYYEQQSLGYNYRLSDIHAALGLSQMKSIDAGAEARGQLSQVYRDLVVDLPVQPLRQLSPDRSSWHLYVVQFDSSEKRRVAYQALRAAGYGVNVHYLPIPDQPYYRAQGFSSNDFSGARTYADRSLSLPLYRGMPEQVVHDVVQIIRESL